MGTTLRAPVALLAGLGLALAPSLAYLAGRVRLGVVSDADHLMLAELLPSLASGVGVDDWTIPLANYLVPDWPLYGLALLIGPTPTMTVAAFMALQMGLLALAVNAVARAVDRPSAGIATIASFGLVTAFVARDVLPLTYLAAASTHAGTLALVLLSLATTLRWLGSGSGPGRRHRLLLTGGALAFTAVVSDRLFVVWYLCPAATALALVTLVRRLAWSDLARWLAAHMAAATLALPVPTLLFPNPTPYSVSVRQGSFRFGLAQYRRSVEATLAINPVQTGAVVMASLVLGVILLRRRSLVGHALVGPGSVFLLAHLGATTVWVSLGVAAVGDGIAPHMRHYLILFVLPLALAPVVALSGLEPRLLPGRSRQRLSRPVLHRVLTVVALLPVGATAASAVLDLPNLQADRPTVPLGCIEEAATRFGSSRGVASYWDARPIEVFSRGRLDMATVSPLLAEDPTNADLSEFAPTYDFAVTSTHIPAWQLPLDRLVRLTGPPRYQQVCGPFTVSNWGPGRLDLHPVDEVGASVSLPACDLPSQLAQPEPDGPCVLAAGIDPPPGFLAYGPYVGLVPGRYRFTLRVRSTATAAIEVADWDVIFDGNTEDPADRGSLNGTDGAWLPVEIDVTVPAGTDLDTSRSAGATTGRDLDRVTVEVRLDPSTGPVELSAMTIERIS